NETLERDVLSRVSPDRRAFVRKYLIGSAFAAPFIASYFMADAAEASASCTSIVSNSSDPAPCYEYFKFRDGPGIDVFVHNTSIHGQLIGPVPGSKTAGVVGTGPDVGVYGVTADASGIGVFAANTGGGFALEVAGKAEFSTTGQGTIPASKKKFFV